ncbi:MAG: hypothetical protein ACLP50_15975 [Solirubrobacteraceae bacterium]
MAHDQDDETPASPFSSTGFQLSVLFLLVLVVAGIAIALFHGGNGTAKGNQKQVIVSTNSATGTLTTSSTGPCSLQAGSQQVPSGSPPAGVTWSVVGSMSVPQSPTLGPQHVVNGVDVCFAHNPSGALLAAMNLWAEGTNRAISHAALFQARAVGAPASIPTSGYVNSGGPVQLAGYQITSYSPSQANVEVVLQGAQDALISVLTPLVWKGDDWKYVFPTEGVPAMEKLPGTTLGAPYVSWSNF